MDPNATLERLRELVAEVAKAESNEHKADIADEMSDLIEGLDNWFCRGGFRPRAWCYGSVAPSAPNKTA